MSTHFADLLATGVGAPPAVQANLAATADRLEAFRSILGVPMKVVSGYRTPEHNAEVGGSPTSDHVQGLAADVELEGLSMYDAYAKLKDTTLAYDQIEYGAWDGHIHFGFGARMRRQQLVELKDGSVTDLTDSLVAEFPGAP